MGGNIDFLHQLETIIDARISGDDDSSYVKGLVSSGLDRVLKKVGEEAGEVIIAAKNGDPDEMLNESADLLFHLMLALKSQGYSIGDVVDVLMKRHGA